MHGGLKIPGKPDEEDLVLKKLDELIIKYTKQKRIYEDGNFVIDLMTDEKGYPMLRVSIFDRTGKFMDEEFVKKSDYLR
jgi:hypothetical protein